MTPTHPKRQTLDDGVMYGIDRRTQSQLRVEDFVSPKDRFFFTGTSRRATLDSLRFHLKNKITLSLKLSVLLSVVFSLLFYSRGADEEQRLLGSTSIEWFHFIFVVLLVEVGTACADSGLFVLFERLWRGSFRIVYYAHCLHGPLGHFLTLVVVVNVLGDMSVPQALPKWRPLVTSAVVVLLLYTAKGYWQRRHFVGLLELRFRDKLSALDACQTVLSILARPPPPTPLGLPSSSPDWHVTPPAPPRPKPSPYQPCSWLCGWVGWLWVGRGAENTEEEEGGEGGGDTHRQDLFWERMDCIRLGMLVVSVGQRGQESDFGETGGRGTGAHGGEVRIRSKAEAVWLGKRLYQHLSQHMPPLSPPSSQRPRPRPPPRPQGLPSSLLCSLLAAAFPRAMQDEEQFSRRLAICTQAGLMFGYTPSPCHSHGGGEGEGGGGEQEQEQLISEEQLVAGVCSAYRTLRHASASMANLQDLHRSVADITDMAFWVTMVLMLHTIFGFRTYTSLTPLLTIIFGLSFALGPSVGSLCLSVVFVMFMLPYDVGNRVCITAGSGQSEDRVVGNVAAITLGYTTIITIYNEKLRIPNHMLFHRSIANMNESVHAVLEVLVRLPLVCADVACFRGGRGRDVSELHAEFWRRVEKCVRSDRVEEWQDMMVACRELETTSNTVLYAVWLTHRAGWHEVRGTSLYIIYSGNLSVHSSV